MERSEVVYFYNAVHYDSWKFGELFQAALISEKCFICCCFGLSVVFFFIKLTLFPFPLQLKNFSESCLIKKIRM